MSTIEIMKELEQKRGEIARLFTKNADGEYNMSAVQLDEIRDRNAELAKLNEKYRLASMEEENSRELKGMQEPVQPMVFGRGITSTHTSAKSLGEQLVEAKGFGSGFRGAISVSGINEKTLMSTSAGWAPESLRSGEVALFPSQAPVVADYFPKVSTNQAAYKFMEQTTRTNAATEGAEGGIYAEAAEAFTERTVLVEKFGVFLPVTDEQLADVPAMRDVVNNDLRLMLEQRLDSQLVNGTGNTPQIRGMLNVASTSSQAKGTDPAFDAFLKAIVKVQAVGFAQPNAIFMSPTDYQNLLLTRTADGLYILGNPGNAPKPNIWGVDLVPSTVVTAATAIVADTRYLALVIREGSFELKVSDSHDTYFQYGKLAVRASFRAAAVCKRPKAICTVTGL